MMMLQSIAALAAVLALFAVLVWGMKRLQYRTGSSETSSMRVLQKISLDTRHSLVEVQHGNYRYLLGLSTDGMDVIDKTSISNIKSQVDDGVQ